MTTGKGVRIMLVIVLLIGLPAIVQAQARVYRPIGGSWSGTLAEMAGQVPAAVGPARVQPLGEVTAPEDTGAPDTAVQGTTARSAAATPGISFEGLGSGFPGYLVRFAPPDTNGAVGTTQYVQWVNADFAIFDKATGLLVPGGGPFPGNAPWAGFGGGCQLNNDGDPIVQYDKMANRWIYTQFSVSTLPFLQCFAITTGPDARGPFFRFAFSFGNVDFPDYPKLGVMPNGYYMSFNIFRPQFAGPRACAIDRATALAGMPPLMICFQLGRDHGSLLPADLDGPTPPSDPTQDFFAGVITNAVTTYKLKPNFATPPNSTLTGPTILPVLAFTIACAPSGGSCIPQPNSETRLDALGDRPMYRLAYRNRAGVESMVVNHSVRSPTSASGVRWYELRVTGGNTSIFQQGTFAPADAISRWMGSIAMDKCGDIQVGYSVSAPSGTFPGIRTTGRVPSDPPGQLQAETVIQNGSGSQTQGLNRWGDYSAMQLDPVDDSTFWFTTEYMAVNGRFNWRTRIASMKFASCP